MKLKKSIKPVVLLFVLIVFSLILFFAAPALIPKDIITQNWDVNNHRDAEFANGQIKAKRSLYNEKIIWDEFRLEGMGVMRVNYLDGNVPTGKRQNLSIETVLSADTEKMQTACVVDLKADESVGEVTLFGGGAEQHRIYYKEHDLEWPDSYDPVLGLTEKAHAACKALIEVYLDYGKLDI